MRAINAVSTHCCSFTVPLEHPAIPGHFPGNPVVPGVLIIERVIDAAEAWLGRPLVVTAVPHTKFIAPLRPGEQADLALTLDGSALAYVVRRDGELLSRGALELQRPESA